MRLVLALFQFCALICVSATAGFSAEATKLSDLNALAAGDARTIMPARVEARVLWVSPAANRIALQDDSANAIVEIDLHDQAVKPGQKLFARGLCLVENHRLQFGSSLVVNNDGFHPAIERSGSIYLSAGKHPIRVGYFDGGYKSALAIEYEGPGFERQRIPAKALFHSGMGADGLQMEPGLSYRRYVGFWSAVPDFSTLTPANSGVVGNFNLHVRDGATNVALLFTGWIDAPRAGYLHVPFDLGRRQPPLDRRA